MLKILLFHKIKIEMFTMTEIITSFDFFTVSQFQSGEVQSWRNESSQGERPLQDFRQLITRYQGPEGGAKILPADVSSTFQRVLTRNNDQYSHLVLSFFAKTHLLQPELCCILMMPDVRNFEELNIRSQQKVLWLSASFGTRHFPLTSRPGPLFVDF